MKRERIEQLTSRYPKLRIALLGDFSLNRHLEIAPGKDHPSSKQGKPVYNVTDARAVPGEAGTVLNNLAALGIARIHAIGFCGRDGEGYELLRALRAKGRVVMDGFFETPLRRTLACIRAVTGGSGSKPDAFSTLELKNWTPTPPEVERKLIGALREIASDVDAIIVLDRVDIAETGVVTAGVRAAIGAISLEHPALPIVAASRRILRDWPPVILKMNREELATLLGRKFNDAGEISDAALDLARTSGRPVFITLAEEGMVGADPGGPGVEDDAVSHRAPALPVRGEIDASGAGDAVCANIGTALAAGAEVPEALEMANAAASIVIHQIGTPGAATLEELRMLL